MRRFLPSLSALQAFDSAARHMSFTRAAEDLLLTQSGISRQINNLESCLGVRLFERVGSRLVLTDAGKSYAVDVQRILDGLEEVSIDAVRGRKASLSLMVGTQPTLASRWLVPRLRGFRDAHPDIPLEIREIEPSADLADLPVDIAILRGLGTWAGARSVELFAERLVIVGSPALLERIDTGGELDFRTVPTLQNARRPSLWLNWLRASGRGFDGAIQGLRLSHSEMVIRAAMAGLGVAPVPLHYIERELANGELVRCFGEPVTSGESYWLVIPDHKATRGNVIRTRDWILRMRQR